MSAAYVSVRVAENTRHSAHLHVSGTGVLDAWLYIGEGNDVALWGSPAALRRLAAALVLAAEEADELVTPRHDARLRDGALLHACRSGEPAPKAVVGS
jgi:hypothetical protein